MAAPRVFVSSTYYDLKQYRSNIADFISGLGYEPIMHERSGVAYTQTQSLEVDCYHELASCDIVVCIIGNHFGSQSSESELSVTMEELQTALKNKKKIYVFIANDVYIENRTYRLNRETGNFRSAYTDNLKIHEYISELSEKVKNHVILPFETTDQIIAVLRAQFAGLFQNYLAREATMTEAKTAYDLQETADSIRRVVESFSEEKEEFFRKFDSTIISNNMTLTVLKKYLGLTNSAIFATDISSLQEIMTLAGYDIIETDDENDLFRYQRITEASGFRTTRTITFCSGLFDDNMSLKNLRSKSVVDENLHYVEETDDISDELPF